MAEVGEDPANLDAILITHEHVDHVAGLSVLARKLNIPVFFTEPTHRAWVQMITPRTKMTYAKWLEHIKQEKAARAAAVAAMAPASDLAAQLEDESGVIAGIVAEAGAHDSPEELNSTLEMADAEAEALCEPVKREPSALPAVEFFQAGSNFSIGDLDIIPFTIPHDAADPCGFVFHSRSESVRMAVATDLGYMPPNVKAALRAIDVLLIESNHDLEMLKDGPYPWSVKQRVLSRVGHLSNAAAAEFLTRDYDGGAHTIVLGHLSEQNNLPELARLAAEKAIGDRLSLLGNRVLLAQQDIALEPIRL